MNTTACPEIEERPPISDKLLTSNLDILVLAATVFSTIACFTLFSNMIVIIALVKFRHHDHKGTKALVASMSFADALVGAFIMPFSIYQIINNGLWYLGTHLCTSWFASDVMFSTVSIFHVLNLTIHRYIAICKPLTYCKLTKRISYLMISLSWLAPVILVMPWILGNWYRFDYDEHSGCPNGKENEFICYLQNPAFHIGMAIISFYVPLFIIFSLYILIYLSVKRSSRIFLPSMSQSLHDEESHKCETSHENSKTQNEVSKLKYSRRCDCPESTKLSTCHRHEAVITMALNDKRKKAQHRTAFAIGRIVLCFTICWLPFCALILAQEVINLSVSSVVFLGVSWLGYFNSALNPWIYCSHKTVKNAIVSLLRPGTELKRRRLDGLHI